MTTKCFKHLKKVGLGDGTLVDALGTGKVYVNMQRDVGCLKGVLHRVLYVPKLACNLFSVKAAVAMGKTVKFEDNKCWIHDDKGHLCATGSVVNKLYQLDSQVDCEQKAMVSAEKGNNMDLWHHRCGHVNEQQLNSMVQKRLTTGVTFPKKATLSFCESSVEGKMHRKPFKPVGEIRSTRKLKLVHSDVCGPMPTESVGGNKYFVTFIDDYSRFSAVYFMKNKSEVLQKFKEFEAVTTNECGQRIGTLRSDNGGEYISNEFQCYLKSKGIHHELTIPYTPEQNGVAERMNRTLMETACSMMSHAHLPDSYWAEAVATAAYVRNRVPTTAIKEDVTPYERWCGRKPNLAHLRVFGCIAYAFIPDEKRKKLDKKEEKLRFVGYCKESKGYRLIDERTGHVFKRRDVIFNEQDFGHQTKTSVNPDEDLKPEEDISPEEEEQHIGEEHERQEDHPGERQYPRRQRRPPVRYGKDEYVAKHVNHVAFKACQIAEPKNMEEALAGEHAEEWKKAADEEFHSLIENETWELVELPHDRKPIGSKWVFKVKHSSSGEVERFKGHLVAKGYAQKHGLDYDETFSPVVRFSSIRALAAFAIQNDMQIHQMDVVTAFLNGELDEKIYMEQPEGYVQAGKEHLVCKLKKSLYGLKQSPRCWNKAFTDYLESIGFKESGADSCVFVRTTDDVTIVAVYMDDLILLAKTTGEMQEVKDSLSSRFKMKDLGKLHYCLGISIVHDEYKKCLWMHQQQYIKNMLEKYGLSDANTVSTPGDLSVKLKKDDGFSKNIDSVLYQSMIGSLLYAANSTRPDIAHAVGVVSRFASNPSQAHLTAVKRIMHYLKKTVDLAIKYQKSKNGYLIGYSDADWAGDIDDRHSTTGNLFLMAGGPISWQSKKQKIVALSTSEAEYVALGAAVQEAVWLRRLLTVEDNQGAIALAKNQVGHARTKHIDIRYHYIRETVQQEVVTLSYCTTKNMLADLLTKPLPREQFETLLQAMGMEPTCQLSGSVVKDKYLAGCDKSYGRLEPAKCVKNLLLTCSWNFLEHFCVCLYKYHFRLCFGSITRCFIATAIVV